MGLAQRLELLRRLYSSCVGCSLGKLSITAHHHTPCGIGLTTWLVGSSEGHTTNQALGGCWPGHFVAAALGRPHEGCDRDNSKRSNRFWGSEGGCEDLGQQQGFQSDWFCRKWINLPVSEVERKFCNKC